MTTWPVRSSSFIKERSLNLGVSGFGWTLHGYLPPGLQAPSRLESSWLQPGALSLLLSAPGQRALPSAPVNREQLGMGPSG